MTTTRPCWLVTNPASGSNSAETETHLSDLLEQFGMPVARHIAFPDEDLPGAPALDEAGVDLVVCFTGDGSANALIGNLSGWGGDVLILPGGTMNLLARRLHRELDLETIIGIVGKGGGLPVRLSTATCEAGTAYAGLLVGPGTSWSRVRESMRELDVAGLAGETLEAMRETANGPCVRPGAGLAAREEGYPLIEITPGEHGMQVDGYYADQPLEYAEQAWATLRRRFREGPHDLLGMIGEMRIESVDGSPLPCLVDGEPVECASGSTFAVDRTGVKLIATNHEH